MNTNMLLYPAQSGSWIGRNAAHKGSAVWRWLKNGTVVLLAVYSFVHLNGWLRWLDPTAAGLDIGVLSIGAFAILLLPLFAAVSRWLCHLLWPVLGEYLRDHFERNFKVLLPWQKVVIYLSVFFLFLYAWVATLAVVM